MTFKFKDLFFSRELRFSIGQEEITGKQYISFPVRNPYVEYEEYYALSDNQFMSFMENPNNALIYLEECRDRRHDDLMLFYNPNLLRGTTN